MGVFPLPIETFGHSNDAAAKDDDPGVSESRPTMIWIGLNYTLGEKSFNITIFTSPALSRNGMCLSRFGKFSISLPILVLYSSKRIS